MTTLTPHTALDCTAAMPSPSPGRAGAIKRPEASAPAGIRLAPDTGAAAASQHRPLNRVRVLVVEDAVDVAEQLQMALLSWGHDSRVCTSGSEALALATYYQPQVVLIDIGLPDMNGWHLARKLHRLGLSDLPIMIAVTAYSEQADFRQSELAGISFHLVKPAYHTQLKQILERIRPWPEQPSTTSSPEDIDKQVQRIAFNARQLPHADRRTFVIAACRDLHDVGLDAAAVRDIERQVLDSLA